MRGHARLMIDRAFFEVWQQLTVHDSYPSSAFGRLHTEGARHLREPEPSYAIGNGVAALCPNGLADSASKP